MIYTSFSYYTEFSIAEIARLLLVPIAILVYFFSTSNKEAEDTTHREMQNNSSPQKKKRWDSSGPEAMQLFCDCYFRKYKKATKIKTIHEKLAAVADHLELFVFFKYYDGYKTGGEIGFNANSGPPGSINHKRAYTTILAPMTESQFRDKGKLLSSLAQEFIANDIEPLDHLRPIQPNREVPWSMINEALSGGF
jgi:hypothetical protein